MGEQGEFCCERTSGWHFGRWVVKRRTGSLGDLHVYVATFQGDHAEADARAHAERCNARAQAERKAQRPWPRFTAEPASHDDRGSARWWVVVRDSPTAPDGYICREFTGDGAKVAAHVLAERLNAAVAAPG